MTTKAARKEIYTYTCPFTSVYGLAASNRAGAAHAFRYAVGSFVEEYCNKIEVRGRRLRARMRAAACCACTMLHVRAPRAIFASSPCLARADRASGRRPGRDCAAQRV
jgi:hypothetical protein